MLYLLSIMDHYKTLGVDRNASQDDIKRAYRSLASKNHPDKGGDTARFQEIQSAYAVLSDAEKKQEYDNPQPQGFHHASGMGSAEFADVFGHMFGGGDNPFGNIFGQRRQAQRRNQTLNIQTDITLEEAFTGKDLIANLTLPSGREQVLEVKIPRGVHNGVVLRLAALGDDTYTDLPRGDLHLCVMVREHPVFQRQGDDLAVTKNISCIDAMLGCSVAIDTIDNKTIEVKVLPGTQEGSVLGASGFGMPKISDNRFKGRLLIKIHITIPTDLTDAQKLLLAQFNN